LSSTSKQTTATATAAATTTATATAATATATATAGYAAPTTFQTEKDNKTKAKEKDAIPGIAIQILQFLLQTLPTLRIALKEVLFSAKIRLELTDLTPEFPCFKKAALSLMAQPTVDFSFEVRVSFYVLVIVWLSVVLYDCVDVD
jgi:hypothetical protein